jgi:hypothetical protein
LARAARLKVFVMFNPRSLHQRRSAYLFAVSEARRPRARTDCERRRPRALQIFFEPKGEAAWATSRS